MGMLVVAGDEANILERVVTTPTASPAEDSNYGVANLYDRFPQKPFRWGASSSAGYISLDLNEITNGNMETLSSAGSTNLGTWIESNGGSGDVEQTTVAGEFSVGAAGMKLTAGTSSASAYQDIVLRSGEKFTVTVDSRSTAAGISSRLRVQCLETGNYLSTDAAWGATAVDAITNATSSFATVALSATVEAISITKQDLVHLRITALNNSTGNITYMDELYVWPSVDFVSIHGHNLDPVVTVTLQSSTDSFTTTTTQATFTVGQPSFYTALGTLQDIRYWRVQLSGTNSTHSGIPYIGELMVSQKLAPGDTIRYNPELVYTDWQVRSGATPASARSYLLGDHETRALTMNFLYGSTANFAEALNAILRRSRFGHHPLVVVPLSSEADVIYGKIDESVSITRPTIGLWETQAITLTELPFPAFVS